ncbi:MAG: methyltransferase domain-containing protein [Deltaproteobacteria bacterium]
MPVQTVSVEDVANLGVIRDNVNAHLRYVADTYATKSGRLLDIAPQIHEGARPFFSKTICVETFDIDPASCCTYIGDICALNSFLQDEAFDYIVCTEVLEHTLDPFGAVKEMHRLLKVNGYLFLTVPFNFRIHGPLPDCWRFTEYGLRRLLDCFDVVELRSVESPGRPLMPIHYTVVAKKRQN